MTKEEKKGLIILIFMVIAIISITTIIAISIKRSKESSFGTVKPYIVKPIMPRDSMDIGH